MNKSYKRKMAIVAATAGLVAMPLAGSAFAVSDGDDGGVMSGSESGIDQQVEATVSIDQKSNASSGGNEQTVYNWQGNETGQSAVSKAHGGGATAIVLADEAEGDVSATGGEGGTAGSGNTAGSTNSASGGNTMGTGAAGASNAVSGSVGQTQTNTSTNTASATTDDDDAAASAQASSGVDQHAQATVMINQEATANSGRNSQSVDTWQGNSTQQSATSSAAGGDAVAMPVAEEAEAAVTATGGAGGSAASANTATSANTASGGNSMTTGAATSSNSASVMVTQSSTNTNTNTSDTTFTG